jgi:predicted nucleic acid-binding Zn ribbon protein
MKTPDPSVVVPVTHIKCQRCGKDMPAKADACPHCGRATKRTRVRRVLFAVGALVLLILLGVGAFMK